MGQLQKERDEKRMKRNRNIYEALTSNHRVMIKELAKILQVNPTAASRILKEAFDQGYVLIPQVRKQSYANTREYMYFVRCKYSHGLYKKYSNDMNVSYHAVMGGFANLWVISNKEIDIEGDIIVGGPRSDYHVAYAPNHSWEKAMEITQKRVEFFNPKKYKQKRTIKTHWDKTILWDEEDEAIFREFKYNGRKPLTPIMRKHLISSRKIYEFLENLPKSCTVYTRYFPKSIMSYDPYLFMFETDYEDFIIDLFSELPTSSFFFKVSDILFLYTNVDRTSVRKVGVDMSDVSQMHIPLLVDDLLERGILKTQDDSIIKYHWRKNL